MREPRSRSAYFDAHDAVVIVARSRQIQAGLVSRLSRQLAQEQAVLAVLDLQLIDLETDEDRARLALG